MEQEREDVTEQDDAEVVLNAWVAEKICHVASLLWHRFGVCAEVFMDDDIGCRKLVLADDDSEWSVFYNNKMIMDLDVYDEAIKLWLGYLQAIRVRDQGDHLELAYNRMPKLPGPSIDVPIEKSMFGIAEERLRHTATLLHYSHGIVAEPLCDPRCLAMLILGPVRKPVVEKTFTVDELLEQIPEDLVLALGSLYVDRCLSEHSRYRLDR